MSEERTDPVISGETEHRAPRRRRMDRYRTQETYSADSEGNSTEREEGRTETPGAAAASGKEEPVSAFRGGPSDAAENGRASENESMVSEGTVRTERVRDAASRVPEQARRMSENPYRGSPAFSGASAASRRGAMSRQAALSRPESLSSGNSSVRVGYPSGRMSEDYTRRMPSARRPQDGTEESPAPGISAVNSAGSSDRNRSRKPQRVTAYPENRYQQPRQQTAEESGRREAVRDSAKGKRKRNWLIIPVIILVVIGLIVAAVQLLPDTSVIRQTAADTASKILGGGEGQLPEAAAQGKVLSFEVNNNKGLSAPADVTFYITTVKSVEGLRLVDEDGIEIVTDNTLAQNSDNNSWILTLKTESGLESRVSLQLREGEEWISTQYEAEIEIASPVKPDSGENRANSAETAEQDTAETSENATVPDETAEAGDETSDGYQEEQEPGADEEGPENETEPEEYLPENEEDIPEEDPWNEDSETEDDPEGEDAGDGADSAGDAEAGENGEENTAADNSEDGGEAAASPENGSEEQTASADTETEERPVLKVSEDIPVNADPSLITTTVIYNGTKKVSEYTRAAKEVIRMPIGGEYTRKPMGVLTFRSDAFRQNAASGTVENAEMLEEAWQAEAGSVRGASQTYYGISWTGQPAIIKWTKEVREKSNMYESKLEVSGLKEVIIAGIDGNIHFLDLADGSLTRNSIKLGYPMKGTPSLHPSGFPYMNVGQFARKMKVKTGKIGIRQYNLYSQKEMTLIDGLDGKNHRPYNEIGSFETSALIDRTSDTMITAGSNGALYLVSLGSNFDYLEGVYTQSPSTVMMVSKAKGQKKTGLMAVEASIAMYERYVYYADMGGILRCVDTDTLRTIWAVDTGDSVESTPALDLNDSDGLDLYTANTLNNRSKGTIKIRRYNALSGSETWNTEISVRKDSKTKAAVGALASPVVGQNDLSDIVYYTITGLSDDGAQMLGLESGEKSALIALGKKDGDILWAMGMADECMSSPVAVYSEDGRGWIIQCASDGTVYLLDGETGDLLSSLKVEGTIEASPAVYNDMMVIGTTGKGTSYIYGIRIR